MRLGLLALAVLAALVLFEAEASVPLRRQQTSAQQGQTTANGVQTTAQQGQTTVRQQTSAAQVDSLSKIDLPGVFRQTKARKKAACVLLAPSLLKQIHTTW